MNKFLNFFSNIAKVFAPKKAKKKDVMLVNEDEYEAWLGI